ncbi:MAG TPA: response regulator [bacterium]|mgnify:CR=1 FL=1|nr:response regulator [bacterium]HPN42429.1 response regulator [bacterium]
MKLAKKKLIVVGTIDFGVVEGLKQRLNGADYEVRFIQKGISVLVEILDNDVDLLILDLELAGVMGVEILPVIRRLRPRLPVILITDDFTHRIRKIAAELGITYQAYKPMSQNETEAIITATEKIVEKNAVNAMVI